MSISALPNQCGVGTACPACGRRLPLRFAEQGEEAALWECVGCDGPFAGVVLPELLTMLAQRVRLSQRHLDVEGADPLPFTLQQVIERIHSAEPTGEVRDLRRSVRLAGLRNAVASFVDARHCLTGSARHCAIANLSTCGMLMVTGVPVMTSGLILQVDGPREVIQLFAKVVWTRHLGGGCYGTGAALVARFGKMGN